MSNAGQYNIVKNALDLEVNIRDCSNEINKLSKETFRPAPSAPVLQTVNRVYPPVEVKVKYRWYMLLLPILILLASPLISMLVGSSSFAVAFVSIVAASTFIWIPGYLIVQHFRKKKAYERGLNSKKYKKLIEEYDKSYDLQQQQLNQKYSYELSVYNNQTLPQYNRELTAWQAQRDSRLAYAKNMLATSKNQLANLYRSSRLIPSHYRNIDALEHICSTLSSANCDITFAINVYDSHCTQLILDESNRLKEQLRMQEMINNQLLTEHNDRLDETNELIKAIRNDQRIIGAVNTVQNVRSNYLLKGIRNK